jgi:hypothetical protein
MSDTRLGLAANVHWLLAATRGGVALMLLSVPYQRLVAKTALFGEDRALSPSFCMCSGSDSGRLQGNVDANAFAAIQP